MTEQTPEKSTEVTESPDANTPKNPLQAMHERLVKKLEAKGFVVRKMEGAQPAKPTATFLPKRKPKQ